MMASVFHVGLSLLGSVSYTVLVFSVSLLWSLYHGETFLSVQYFLFTRIKEQGTPKPLEALSAFAGTCGLPASLKGNQAGCWQRPRCRYQNPWDPGLFLESEGPALGTNA